MGRAPCCEKLGLKKGPWTPEEDRILMNYVQKNGHTNWRKLPKQAGLLRCGKSCRLRWINYLRPDIKRGNFTKEEEDTIIQLHETLGNRWSAIASKLPGRTDNEIKNVWHTYLKKKLPQNNGGKVIKRKTQEAKKKPIEEIRQEYLSPSSSMADSCNTESQNSMTEVMITDSSISDEFAIDDHLWLNWEVVEASYVPSDSLEEMNSQRTSTSRSSSYNSIGLEDDLDFWYDLFLNSGGIEEVL